MIINKEQRDYIDEYGNPSKELIISYINKEGQVSYMNYKVPYADMFAWKYGTRKNADPIWKSYDDKFVTKYQVDSLPDIRINEILCSFGDYIAPIFEMNRPIAHYYDIEVDVDENGFPDQAEARNPINTIAITRYPKTVCFGRKHLTKDEIEYIQKKLKEYSPLTKDYEFEYKEYENEALMLQSFFEYIKPIPCLYGWNSIDYDWTYIYNRSKNIGLDIMPVSPTGKFEPTRISGKKTNVSFMNPLHKIIADYLIIYKQWDQTVSVKENNTLDFVAEKILGVKKVKHSMGFKEFYENYYKDYVFYNLVDTILVEQIDLKNHTADIWYSLASELHIELNDAFSTIRPVETVASTYVYAEHKIIPNKKASTETKGYEGAFVWPSRPGIYKYIGALDYASLYPSTMRQFNISPETWLGRYDTKTYKVKPNEIITSSGSVYKRDVEGMIPRILTDFFAKRKDSKKMKKRADSECQRLKHILEERERTKK